MKVLYTLPPNYHAINAAFSVRGKSILFAYGDTIHNPSRIKIPPALMLHEGVHLMRQGSDPAGWWARYIAEPKFRLAEEIPAHIAEYDLMKSYDGPDGGHWLNVIAERLASPLYGSLIGKAEARRILIEGARSSDTTA